jgi:hypothetical protein
MLTSLADASKYFEVQLALLCGLLAAALLLRGGPAAFAAMGTAPELLAPARQYLSIRRVPGRCLLRF